MKLTIKTALGGFDFQLSQTSVIYLLDLARKLEEEGDPKFDVNNKVYNINRIVDTADEADELPFPDAEESEQEEPDFAEGKEPEQEQPQADEETEDFGQLLEEYEQKQKRNWNDVGENEADRFKAYVHGLRVWKTFAVLYERDGGRCDT